MAHVNQPHYFIGIQKQYRLKDHLKVYFLIQLYSLKKFLDFYFLLASFSLGIKHTHPDVPLTQDCWTRAILFFVQPPVY